MIIETLLSRKYINDFKMKNKTKQTLLVSCLAYSFRLCLPFIIFVQCDKSVSDKKLITL